MADTPSYQNAGNGLWNSVVNANLRVGTTGPMGSPQFQLGQMGDGGTNYFADGSNGAGFYAPNPGAGGPGPQAHMGVPDAGAGVYQGGSYYPDSTQTNYEKQAGVSAPQYFSSLNDNGSLKAPFQVDPNQSAAFKAMSDNATSTDLSPWAQMQQQALGTQTQQLRDSTNAQQQGANNAAIEKLMTTGNGVDSGSRALTAAMGERSNIMANQNIGAQAMNSDMGIRQADATNKASMLGQVANTQTSAQAANAQAGLQDLTNANAFSANRYTQQMQAWGAQQTANAQAQAASSAGGGKK